MRDCPLAVIRTELHEAVEQLRLFTMLFEIFEIGNAERGFKCGLAGADGMCEFAPHRPIAWHCAIHRGVVQSRL